MVNFTTVACRISPRLKWYKNYKDRSRLTKVIVKNNMSRFLWFTVYITNLCLITNCLETSLGWRFWCFDGLFYSEEREEPDGGLHELPPTFNYSNACTLPSFIAPAAAGNLTWPLIDRLAHLLVIRNYVVLVGRWHLVYLRNYQVYDVDDYYISSRALQQLFSSGV